MADSIQSGVRDSRLRRAARDSAVLTAARAVCRPVAGAAGWVVGQVAVVCRRAHVFGDAEARAVAASSRSDDEASREQLVHDVLAKSRLVRALDHLLELPVSAWPSSALARRVVPIAREIRTLEHWQQIRLAGWMLLVGLSARVLTHVVMCGSVGAVSGAVWIGVAVFAVLLMAWSRPIAAAWSERQARRARKRRP